MLSEYRAAMNVKYDLEEWKREEEAEMEIEIPEEEALEIKTTIEYLVKKKDKVEITNMLQGAYDVLSEATLEREKQPESEELTVKYQQAKEKYALNKKYYTDALKPIVNVQETNLIGGWNTMQPMNDYTETLVTGW